MLEANGGALLTSKIDDGTAGEARLVLDLVRARREGPAGLARRQQRRLTALVGHARAASRLYQRHLDGCAPDTPLTALPPITKTTLMSAFDDWVTDPRVTRAGVEAFIAAPDTIGLPFLDRHFVCSTSGTTGHPGRFVHDRGAIAVYRALTARLIGDWLSPGELARLVGRGMRWVALVGTGGHFAGESWFAMEQRRDFVRRRGYHVLSIQRPLPEIVAALQAIAPAGLTVYPSALTVLADEQTAGRLQLRPVFIELGGESMEPAARARAARVFGCPVHDAYSCSEALSMAGSCAHGHLHVNSDWMILEPVDADHRPTPPGTTSHTVLLTNLANRVAPIIRYDLGDAVRALPGPCPCGNILPAINVLGRGSEVLRFVVDGHAVQVPSSVLGVLVAQLPGARRVQLVQRGPDTLAIRLDPVPGANVERVQTDVINALRTGLVDCGLGSLKLEHTDERPVLGAGKCKPIVVENS